MNNKIFGKTAALVTGTLMVFCGQAVAFSYNNHESGKIELLPNSEIFVAQGANACSELKPGVSVAVAVGVAVKAYDRSIAVVRTVSVTKQFPPEAKAAVIKALERVQKTLGEALAEAKVGDNVAVAKAISKAVTVGTGVADVVAEADAGAANVITSANTCANRAESIVKAETEQPK